jgi:hypothetical protein
VSSQGNPQKSTQGTAPHHGSFNSLNSTHDVGWASFEDEESQLGDMTFKGDSSLV